MRILVVAAHPDDEVLGCGGSIAKWCRAGNEVHIIILAEGATSRDDTRDRTLRTSELFGLAKAAHEVQGILGAKSLKLLDFPDNRMDSLCRLDIVKVIEREIESLKPEMVITHHVGDVNIDHRITHEAVVTACRPMPGQNVRLLMAFETLSSTEWQPPRSAEPFMPNWFEDISLTLDIKISALQAYGQEMRSWPHSRSIEGVTHLAKWRGASIGCHAAEAFQLLRNIQ